MIRNDYKKALADVILQADKDNCKREALRELCKNDLFFLLTGILGRKDADNDFVFDRCREVQANPDNYLDLWAREHYKSTIITFALTIQDILRNPEETICIFSHTKPIAKSFLIQIKRELEANESLKELFPDVLYANPEKESPCWSVEKGIIVKRQGNPKECTVEAWGVVDGQPTSKHFSILIYDDLVTLESVTTPEQIKKTTDSWALSLNLGTDGGRKRHIGTRYHLHDTYRTIMDRGVVKPRIYPATEDGSFEGEPVLLSREALNDRYTSQGSYIFSCQMLQNPIADQAQGFRPEWLKTWNGEKYGALNRYILVDPSSSKKKTENDYTTMLVVGVGQDKNFYLIDGIRDKLNLKEKAEKLIELHKQYQPILVAYEEYGIQADIEHIEEYMDNINYRFKITPVGGKISKFDRIRRLIPLFQDTRFYIVANKIRKGYDNNMYDLYEEFLNEYNSFPVCKHDDILDCLARIKDIPIEYPGAIIKEVENEIVGSRNSSQAYDPLSY